MADRSSRLFWLVLSLALLPGCTGPATEPVVLYDGATTDEALAQMLALPSQPGGALTILSPAEGALLDADEPPTVAFAESIAHWQPAERAHQRKRRKPGRPDGTEGWLEQTAQVLLGLPVSTAYAHGAPYNGVAYLLEFTDGAAQLRLRVFTDQASFVVPAAEWAELSSSPGAFTLTIHSATFEENDVVAGGGPFERARATFSVR